MLSSNSSQMISYTHTYMAKAVVKNFSSEAFTYRIPFSKTPLRTLATGRPRICTREPRSMPHRPISSSASFCRFVFPFTRRPFLIYFLACYTLNNREPFFVNLTPEFSAVFLSDQAPCLPVIVASLVKCLATDTNCFRREYCSSKIRTACLQRTRTRR